MSTRLSGNPEPLLALLKEVEVWDETEALIEERVSSVRRCGRKGGPPLRPCLSLDPEDLPRRWLEEGTGRA
jgi:hypothetical protein